MSVEAMTLVTISGPEEMANATLGKLLTGENFHPENAINFMEGTKKLYPFDSSNPYAQLLSVNTELMREMGIEPEYRAFDKRELKEQEVSKELEGLKSKLDSLRIEREQNKKVIESHAGVAKQLGHFDSFDVELSDLFSMRYLKFRFGRIPEDVHGELVERIENRSDVYWFDSGCDQHWVYGGYFVLPADYNLVDSIFTSMGFQKIHFDVEGDLQSNVYETAKRIEKEEQGAVSRIMEIEQELENLKKDSEDLLLKYHSWLKYMNGIRHLRSFAGQRHGKFYVVGWMTSNEALKVKDECEKLHGFACILTKPEGKEELEPPVKLKKGFFRGIYQPFAEMYGLPAYGEIDPRIFLAITYTVLFGIMFGDVGQGALLSIVGLLLWKLKKMWLGRIVALCGVSSVVMGFVYGSVFGSEDLLPGFKVLEGNNTMTILMAAVGLGVCLITVCMILNIITGIRRKDIKQIFFEPNGLAGFVLYVGLAVGVVLKFTKGINIFTPVYMILAVALPIFLIFAATPLTKLIKGDKDWKPESFVMFFVEGFFELFETALSYLSNTVSFLRVGAFAISHAGMMMVVYLLSSGDNGYSIFGLALGNILVTGIEAVLVCIQIMRLEFYEMFGRFYKGGGKQFSPEVVDYSTAE